MPMPKEEGHYKRNPPGRGVHDQRYREVKEEENSNLKDITVKNRTRIHRVRSEDEDKYKIQR